MAHHWWDEDMPPARSVMRASPTYADEDESLGDLAKKLADLEVGEIPVCGPGGDLRGMLSQRDIIAKLVVAGIDPSKVKARELTTGAVVAVSPNDGVNVALQMMHERGVYQLPVVEHHRLVGMIAMRDIFDTIPGPGGAAHWGV